MAKKEEDGKESELKDEAALNEQDEERKEFTEDGNKCKLNQPLEVKQTDVQWEEVDERKEVAPTKPIMQMEKTEPILEVTHVKDQQPENTVTSEALTTSITKEAVTEESAA